MLMHTQIACQEMFKPDLTAVYARGSRNKSSGVPEGHHRTLDPEKPWAVRDSTNPFGLKESEAGCATRRI